MTVARNTGFRAWFYFRNGWSTYFAFIFAAINTLTVTFYLAVEKYPDLNWIFPTFFHYIAIVVGVGVPLLVFVGYAHFKRTSAYRSEADIGMEVNPYFRRILLNTEMMVPFHLKLTELLVKISENEKLSKEDLDALKKLQEELKEHMKLKDTKYQRGKVQESTINKLKELDEN
tara:strand:+ start:334 stop:852 length:519 start_codon:yes stop_codon:yes gene_type:complete